MRTTGKQGGSLLEGNILAYSSLISEQTLFFLDELKEMTRLLEVWTR